MLQLSNNYENREGNSRKIYYLCYSGVTELRLEAMKKIKLLYRILKISGLITAIKGFVVFLLISTIVIKIFEPEFDTYGNALWYLFASFTTIGYGDFVAITLLGRLLTVIVSLYGILIVAFIPAVIISYLSEFKKAKYDETTMSFLDKLERLPSLSKEELEEISQSIKKRRFKI